MKHNLLMYGLLGVMVGCSLGTVLEQPERPIEHIIIANAVNGNAIGKAYQYDGAVLTNEAFSMSLRFNDYQRYFYSDGTGRESPMGKYQLNWGIYEKDKTRNLLISPIYSTKEAKIDNFFTALMKKGKLLTVRDSKDLPTEAIIYLEIRAIHPPYLPAGDYRVEAEVNDGQPGNPETISTFSRQLRVVPQLVLANGTKLLFRVNLSSNLFEVAGVKINTPIKIVDSRFSHQFETPADPVRSYITLSDLSLPDRPDLELWLAHSTQHDPVVIPARFAATSTLPSASPPLLSSTNDHLASKSAVVLRYSNNLMADFDIKVKDRYGQSTRASVLVRN